MADYAGEERFLSPLPPQTPRTRDIRLCDERLGSVLVLEARDALMSAIKADQHHVHSPLTQRAHYGSDPLIDDQFLDEPLLYHKVVVAHVWGQRYLLPAMQCSLHVNSTRVHPHSMVTVKADWPTAIRKAAGREIRSYHTQSRGGELSGRSNFQSRTSSLHSRWRLLRVIGRAGASPVHVYALMSPVCWLLSQLLGP